MQGKYYTINVGHTNFQPTLIRQNSVVGHVSIFRLL